jgi:hypothetical protein
MERDIRKIMTLKQRAALLIYDLDKTLAIIGAFGSICFIIFLVIYSDALGYTPIYLLVFVTLITFFCILWLIIRKYNLLEFYLPENEIRVKSWALCFFLLYIFSILAVYFRPNLYERPLIYFFLTILMTGTIACEICTAKRRHVGLILIQILLLGMSLAASLELIVPSLIGGDPWYHYHVTTDIINNNYIPEGYGYSTMPFFHLIIAISSIVTSLSYKFSALISVSFGQMVIDCIFIFLIANFLFKNHRIGLLSALLIIIGNQNIIRSLAPIPNSLGFAFILIALYIIFTKYKYKNSIISIFIIVLSMISIILTHSLPALMMTIFLFIIWISFFYLRNVTIQKNQFITFFLPCGFFVAMLSWWYLMGTQVDAVTKIIGEAINLDVTAYSPIPDIATKAVMIDPYDIFFTNIGLYIFISISLIGFFYMISKRGNNFTFYFAFISMVPFIFYIILYFGGGFIYSESFNSLSDRWINLIQIVTCIPIALAIYGIGTHKVQNSNYSSFFLGGVIIILSLLMIMTPTGSPDNHLIAHSKNYWSYYSDSENAGNDFFAYNSVGDLYSDRNHAITTSSVFEQVYGINRDRLHMLDFNIQSGMFEHDNSIKIFRSKRIAEFQRVGVISPKIKPNLDTYMSQNGFNKIYQNPMMTGYIG